MENFRFKNLGPTSIQEWAADAEKEAKRTSTLSQKQMMTFMECQLGEQKLEKSTDLRKEFERGDFESQYGGASVLYKRVKDYHTYTISIAAAIYIGSAVNSPHLAIIYANYLQYQAFKFKRKHVDMDFVSIVFSNGFPNEQTLSKVWNAQKIPGRAGDDNMLDHKEYALSIASFN